MTFVVFLYVSISVRYVRFLGKLLLIFAGKGMKVSPCAGGKKDGQEGFDQFQRRFDEIGCDAFLGDLVE